MALVLAGNLTAMWTWQLLVQIRQMLLEVQVGLSALPVFLFVFNFSFPGYRGVVHPAVPASAALIKDRPFPTSSWLFHFDWQASASLALRFVSTSVVLKHAGMFYAAASTCCDVDYVCLSALAMHLRIV